MHHRFSAALVASLFLVACGGGGGDDDDSVDALVIPLPDGGTGTPDSSTSNPDAPPAGCSVAVTASGPAEPAGFYLCGDGSAACPSFDPSAAEFIQIMGPMNADTAPDFLDIELYGGFGVFSGGLATGTYDLTSGDEGNYASCGACIRILSDVNTGTGDYVDDYFQTAGTLTISGFTTGDASNPSTVSGSVSGLVLDHVTINPDSYQSTVVGDCSTNVADFSFTAEVTDYASN